MRVVNKIRYGSMITPGESLPIIESEPAAGIALAANEAEKAVNVQLSNVRAGVWTSVYVGYRAEIDAASQVANDALQSINAIQK